MTLTLRGSEQNRVQSLQLKLLGVAAIQDLQQGHSEGDVLHGQPGRGEGVMWRTLKPRLASSTVSAQPR